MKDQINIGIIGLGNIGSRYPAIVTAEPGVTLTAICDIDEEKCRQHSNSSISGYNNYKKLIDSSQVDAVCICTPHFLHAEMAIRSAKKLKHVLVEKPMALKVEHCKEMIRIARRNKVVLSVVKQNRFNKPVAALKQLMDDDALGKILLLQCNVVWHRSQEYYDSSNWRGNRKKEGGALFTQASHFIDLMIWLFGDIREAKGFMDTFTHEIKIEDSGVAALKFKSGIIGTLLWTTCAANQNHEGSLLVIGEKGIVRIGGQYLNRIDSWQVEGRAMPEFEESMQLDYGSYKGSGSNHTLVFRQFIDKIRKGDYKSGDEGPLKTVSAIQMLYASIDKHE